MSRSKNTDPVQVWMKALKKKLKKKAFRMKVKIVLSAVLPGLIALLGTATARIFLRMALRKAGSGAGAAADKEAGKKAGRKNGILAWPKHTDAPAAAEPDGADKTIQPEPVTLESSRPEFVTPEKVETERL